MYRETPTVTLCVTAHETKYLTECLLSVAAQKVGSYEVILCSDSTGDPAVVRVFERIANTFDVRTQIITVVGGSAGVVRNAAFQVASTPWVAYLDGDDVLMPNAMREVLLEIESDDADIISTGIFRIDRLGRPSEMEPSLTYKPPVWLYHTDPRTLGHWAFFNQFQAIRTSLWRQYPFTETPTNREDVDFMLHQLLAGRFSKIPLALYGYRQVPYSFSSRKYPEGDLCSLRYRDGYYTRLFYQRYTPSLSRNFAR